MPAKLNREVWVRRYAAVGLELLEDVVDTRTPVRCQCLKCGADCHPRPDSIQQGRGGCKRCAGQYTPSQEEFIERFRKADLELLEIIVPGNKPAKCRCLKCGGDCSPRPSDIQKGRGGCQNCADYSYKPNKPGYFYVYLLEDEGVAYTGFGISNVPKSRCTAHNKNFDLYGIKVLRHELLGPFDGGDVARLERQFKKQVNKLETLVCDGFHTESFLGDCFDEVVWDARDQLENR